MAAQLLKEGYNPELSITHDSNGEKVSRVYYVENDNYADGMEYRVLNVYGLPLYGSAYPDADSNMVVTNRRAEPYNNDEGGDFVLWKVTIEWSVPTTSTGESETGWTTNTQALARTQQYEVPFEKGYDSSGKLNVPVQSTSYEPLIGVTKYNANLIIDLSYNVGSFDIDNLVEFKNSTNSKNESIAGIKIDKDKGRIIDISRSAKKEDTFGNNYYTVTASIEVTDTDYKIRPMNRGFMKKGDSTDDQPVLYILKKDLASEELGDTGLERIDEPAKLTEKNEVIVGVGAHYLEFTAYPSLNWGALQFPASEG